MWPPRNTVHDSPMPPGVPQSRPTSPIRPGVAGRELSERDLRVGSGPKAQSEERTFPRGPRADVPVVA